MSKKKIGFNFLVKTIGEEFFKEHQDTAVFSSEEFDEGLFCFLGIDLHPERAQLTLSASLNDWDVYATCYVKENDKIVLDQCRLLK